MIISFTDIYPRVIKVLITIHHGVNAVFSRGFISAVARLLKDMIMKFLLTLSSEPSFGEW